MTVLDSAGTAASSAASTYSNRQYLPTRYYGIWDRSNAYDATTRPFLRGRALQAL